MGEEREIEGERGTGRRERDREREKWRGAENSYIIIQLNRSITEG